MTNLIISEIKICEFKPEKFSKLNLYQNFKKSLLIVSLSCKLVKHEN